MSLLPYVIAFIMVLSAITYSRLQSIKILIPSSKAFTDYAYQSQKTGQHELWKAKYDDISVRILDSKKHYFIDGCAKLSLKPIFAGDSSPPEKKKAYRDLLTRLINSLHHDEPYFHHANAQDPSWLEHLLDALGGMQANSLKDLNELDLKDPLLNTMLYHLLKEEKSLALYCSFSSKQNLSIYLASQELLMAVFQDKAVVAEVHAERCRINSEARKKGDMEQLKKDFGSLKHRFSTSYDPYLTYDISKTYIKP